MEIPSNIKNRIGNRPYVLDTLGRSQAQVILFDTMVLKIERQGEEAERERKIMAWLKDKLPVPEILCSAREEGMDYLLMSRIDGEMSCSAQMLQNPSQLAQLLAQGLKMLWNVDCSNCPCSYPIAHKLKVAEDRVREGLCTTEDAEPETYGKNGFQNPAHLLQWLKENKPPEEPVFSHGDYCLPNIMVKDRKVTGFIDLGRSGIADKYQDIALCYRSLKHNFDGTYGGAVYEDFDSGILFDALKIKPDWEKINYYILLDELF